MWLECGVMKLFLFCLQSAHDRSLVRLALLYQVPPESPSRRAGSVGWPSDIWNIFSVILQAMMLRWRNSKSLAFWSLSRLEAIGQEVSCPRSWVFSVELLLQDDPSYVPGRMHLSHSRKTWQLMYPPENSITYLFIVNSIENLINLSWSIGRS